VKRSEEKKRKEKRREGKRAHLENVLQVGHAPVGFFLLFG